MLLSFQVEVALPVLTRGLESRVLPLLTSVPAWPGEANPTMFSSLCGVYRFALCTKEGRVMEPERSMPLLVVDCGPLVTVG